MTFSFDARVDARRFDVTLTVARGETVAILGPNGAGKSTLLGLIAGLVGADSGRAELDGSTLFDRSARSAFVPPHRRGVSLLAQDALLFPHLSVLENVAFGPRSAGIARARARAMAREWLAEVDATELASRRPAQVSGGQAQRIAVARALATEPKLLLLDEPMAALDVAAAPALRGVLRRVLGDRTAIIVTHDVLDAYSLADRVIVMNDGRIVEEGPTRAVLERPRTAFTAGLAGLNLLTGTVADGGLLLADGTLVRGNPEPGLASGAAAVAALRPVTVTVAMSRPDESRANRIFSVIRDLEPHGDVIRVRSDKLSADVPPALIADLDLTPGAAAWFSFDPEAVSIYAQA